MPEQLFTFDESFSKSDATLAIYDVELKNWNKRSGAQEEKPDLAAISESLVGLSAGEALIKYATGRTTISGSDTPITKDEAKKLGAALIQIEKNNEAFNHPHPLVSTTGSDGKTYSIEPKELSAWLQANAGSNSYTPVDTWAKDNNIGLTAHGDVVQNGAEELYIETRDGQRRTVGNGGLSEPIQGNYGAIRGLKVGDGDDMDVYISQAAMQGIQGGKPYEGKVFVMQQMDGGKPDELKLGYAADAAEFKQIMTSTWKDGRDFEKLNEGKYVELSPKQYAALKEAVKENPTLTLDEFAKSQGLTPQPLPGLEQASGGDTGIPQDVLKEARGAVAVALGDPASATDDMDKSPPQLAALDRSAGTRRA